MGLKFDYWKFRLMPNSRREKFRLYAKAAEELKLKMIEGIGPLGALINPT